MVDTLPTIQGAPWQQLVALTVEIGAVSDYQPGAAGTWDSARWDGSLWAQGFDPAWHDVTAETIAVDSTLAATGPNLPGWPCTCTVELLDSAGDHAPGSGESWYLGRHVRVVATVRDRVPVALFQGIISTAQAGGTVQVPTVTLTAYDYSSMMGTAVAIEPVAGSYQTASERLAIALAIGLLPPNYQQVGDDTTRLMPDDELNSADLFGRTLESCGGIAWVTGDGAIHTAGRSWRRGVADSLAAAIYVGDSDHLPADLPVMTPTSFAGSESLASVVNRVRLANKAEPPDVVTVQDTTSERRYSVLSSTADDLTCDAATLALLAQDRLTPQPVTVVDDCTVTVYDATTARAVELAPPQVVVAGWNVPGAASWEIFAVVAEVAHTISAATWTVDLTLTTSAGLASGPGRWDTALWGQSRWSAPDPERQPANG